jgi:hypothetical protein
MKICFFVLSKVERPNRVEVEQSPLGNLDIWEKTSSHLASLSTVARNLSSSNDKVKNQALGFRQATSGGGGPVKPRFFVIVFKCGKARLLQCRAEEKSAGRFEPLKRILAEKFVCSQKTLLLPTL